MPIARASLIALAAFAASCQCQSDEDDDAEGDVVTDDGGEDTDAPPGAAPASYGSWLSLGVAADGAAITMSSYDRIAGAVDFAIGTPDGAGGVTFSHEPVDGYPITEGADSGDRGKYSSHATASDGTVWIAYQDVGAGALRVAKRVGPRQWETAVVDEGTGEDAGHWVSLAIGADGQPIIASCDGASGSVRLSRFDGSSWSTTTLHTSTAVSHTALYVSGGVERIAFREGAPGVLGLLEGTGTSFTHSVVDDSGDVGAWPSLLAIGDTLYIAYEDVGNGDLRLATRTNGTWITEIVDAGEMRGADTEIFLRGGAVAIVYFDGYDNDQWLATRTATSWDIARLAGQDAMAGYHNEVVTTSAGTWVGSYDFVGGSLVLSAL
jgi:hypothetical protein